MKGRMFQGMFLIVVIFLKHVDSRILIISKFQDDTDYRRGWKNSWRQHVTYAGIDIGWVDAKVASLLCKGGLISYVFIPLLEVMDQWALDHVVPKLSKKVPVEVAKALGRAIFFMLLIPVVKQPFLPKGKNISLKLSWIWEQGISSRRL